MDAEGVPDVGLTKRPGGVYELSAVRTQDAVLRRLSCFWVKRVADVVLSGAALLFLLPLLLLLVIAIKLDSPGPVIFRQRRVGYDRERKQRRDFVMFKLRTMFYDNDEGLHREYVTRLIRCGADAEEMRDADGFLKVTRDPRVTRVGRLLRRTSLDELPQLWNVMRGEMSLVGPRPALPYEVESYSPHHMRRLAATPGCTGLWQVSGWCRLSFEEMVKIDLEYIDRQSFWLDVSVLLRTVPAILARRGGG